MKNIKLSTKPTVIYSNLIHTIEFKLVYPLESQNEYTLINSYLSHLLCESSALIPDESEYEKESLRKTIINYSYTTNSICNNLYLVISFELPQEGLISDYNLEDSFKFIIDTIKNPILNTNSIEKFEHIKDYFKRKHASAKQDIYNANYIEVRNIIDPLEKIGLSYKSYGELLDKITWNDLSTFYNKYIINNDCLVYVYGNIEEEKVEYLFNKYLKRTKEYIEFTTNYIDPLPISNEKLTKINTKFKQSELVMEYQVLDMQEEDKLILSVILNILNAQENNLIFSCLRTKNGLVYDAYVSSYITYGMFTVEAFINSDNSESVISLVKEVIDSLRDKEFLTKCFNKLVASLKIDLLKESDGLYTALTNRINNDLDIKTTEWEYNELLNLDIEDIIKFLDRIKLTNTCLFLESKEN